MRELFFWFHGVLSHKKNVFVDNAKAGDSSLTMALSATTACTSGTLNPSGDVFFQKQAMPNLFRELSAVCRQLEDHYKDATASALHISAYCNRRTKQLVFVVIEA